ncbi:MAG TPA: hypothetical protein EYO33_09365 [Phycisphaerales bacterium]|nr:hypothetical protein [Phycisphaerales bacterium]
MNSKYQAKKLLKALEAIAEQYGDDESAAEAALQRYEERERAAEEKAKRLKREQIARQKLVGQGFAPDFLAIADKLSSLSALESKKLSSAWDRLFVKYDGSPRWMTATPESVIESSDWDKIAFLILGTWRKVTGRDDLMPPPATALRLLRLRSSAPKGKNSREEFAKWLGKEISEASGRLPFTILPPGTDPWRRLGSWELRSIASQAGFDSERISFLESLRPIAWYNSALEAEARYLVAEFDGVAIAESGEEGNAIYFVKSQVGDWKRILALTKAEARSEGAKRIVHDPGGKWRARLRTLVARLGD